MAKENMQQIHIRLPKKQMKWLDAQKEVYGSRATAIRILIDDVMKRGSTPSHKSK
jgi:metal-responsive CopG/Arc/MetJ family transcriptional regulator